MDRSGNRMMVIRGDARRLPLRAGSMDLIVTSPPYFSLRDYGCTEQIGSEATPAEYVTTLVAGTREWARVLKLSGSLFVNLGDVYGDDGSLLDLPHRYAVAVVDDLGLRKRAEIIWSKPHVYGDRAANRVRRTHEVWHHFVLTENYYADEETLREPPEADYRDRPQYRRAVELFTRAGFGKPHLDAVRAVGVIDSAGGRVRSGGSWSTESGRLAWQVKQALGSYYRELCGSAADSQGRPPASVWTVPTEPFKPPAGFTGHFASYPVDWPARLIPPWCPPGGTVLDPCGGTGTTAHAASALGRIGVTVDLSMGYCRLAAHPAVADRRRRKILGLARPDVPVLSEGQLSIFEGEAS